MRRRCGKLRKSAAGSSIPTSGSPVSASISGSCTRTPPAILTASSATGPVTTARDRDLLRERVLRGLEWRIHRVWSTDWWVDIETAIAGLTAAVEADLKKDREEAEAAAAAPTTRPASAFEISDPEVDMVEPQSRAEAEPGETPSRELENATLRARSESRSSAALSDVRADQASFGIVTPLAEDRPKAELGRVDRGTRLDEDGTKPADYVVFNGAAGPDPRTATTEVVADGLCQIIAVEGPMLAKRAYDANLRGGGIRRLGGELRTALNRGLAKAVRDGRVISEHEPGVTGLIHSTVRLQNDAAVRLRVRGGNTARRIVCRR